MVMVGKNYLVNVCEHFMEDYGIEVRIARYHNIYGPYGTYMMEVEKKLQQLYVERLFMQKK